jgi:hypothetical protein
MIDSPAMLQVFQTAVLLVAHLCLLLLLLLQVIDVCQSVNHHLRILRARFSALIPRELQRALQNLVAPNAADAAAVDARQEIDLRIGASFTRLQTLLLQVLRCVQLYSARQVLADGGSWSSVLYADSQRVAALQLTDKLGQQVMTDTCCKCICDS